MAKNRRTYTPLQQEYRKQQKRIQNFIRRAEKRGYQFEENLVPEMPKRVTKQAIERIKSIKPKILYKSAVYGGEASQGEVVQGLEGRKLERKASAQKAKATREYNRVMREMEYQAEDAYTPQPLSSEFDYNDYYGNNEQDFEVHDDYSQWDDLYTVTVIENFREQASYYRSAPALLNWLDRTISEIGQVETANLLQRAYQLGVGLGISIKPSDDQEAVDKFISQLIDYMAEDNPFTADEMMQAMESGDFYEPR